MDVRGNKERVIPSSISFGGRDFFLRVMEMIIVNIKPILRQIERKMRFLPEYFYCQHPADSAPVRILVSGLRYWQRGKLRSSLINRGYVVQYWQAKFKGYG